MEQIQQRQPETTRPQAPRPIGSGVRTGDNDGGTGGTVQVTWGALIDDLDIAGMTVGEVEAALQTTYHLAPGVQTNVNGEEADADTLLASGDSLEFVRAAGEKGSD
jgi:hypothetical protein